MTSRNNAPEIPGEVSKLSFLKELNANEQCELWSDFSNSDSGNTERIRSLYGDRLLYSYPKRSWLVRLDGIGWVRDTRDLALGIALHIMRQAQKGWQLAEEAWPPSMARREKKFIESSLCLSALRRALRLLQLDLTAPDDFDPEATAAKEAA